MGWEPSGKLCSSCRADVVWVGTGLGIWLVKAQYILSGVKVARKGCARALCGKMGRAGEGREGC